MRRDITVEFGDDDEEVRFSLSLDMAQGPLWATLSWPSGGGVETWDLSREDCDHVSRIFEMARAALEAAEEGER